MNTKHNTTTTKALALIAEAAEMLNAEFTDLVRRSLSDDEMNLMMAIAGACDGANEAVAALTKLSK